MKSEEIRKKFIEFFESKGHKEERPSSLVSDDPTTLFTTAGMQQFKKHYFEPSEAPWARVVTIQPCLRTSDIEEVGDESHLTFFEMLGNFSFGYPLVKESYFKKEAIEWAWEFLTSVLGIEKSRLSATYFKGGNGLPKDKKSLEILKGIKELKNIKGEDFKENFWSLGAEGSPGGPTVELYIDGVEVWNLVFNEYIYRKDKFEPSKYKGVDTGMGLERLAVVMQDKNDVFETDLFEPIIKKIEEISGKKYEDNKREFRIIADHLKAAENLVVAGVHPSNKEESYIVRRLIRRTIVKAYNLGIKDNFIAKIIKNSIIEEEEEKFRKNIEIGLKCFEKRVGGFGSAASGKTLFDLYQTYGFPIELSLEIAQEKGIKIDKSAILEYKKEYESHQKLSQTASAGMFKGGLADKGEETTKLHTAAHLLLAALRKVLGDHVVQKGSNITPERLRLDFSHSEKMTPEQIQKTENLVNEQIQKNLSVKMEEMSLKEAKKSGAMGVFDERYGDKVKVYTIGESPSTRKARSGSREKYFSREICGGPHVKNTQELHKFKITKEESSSAGIRRIKAVLE